MEDRTIAPLEKLAADIADIREQRDELLTRERALRGKGLAAMKQYGKARYMHDGIEIRIMPGEEQIKITVRKPKKAKPAKPSPSPLGLGPD
jgi:hypothetical protein